MSDHDAGVPAPEVRARLAAVRVVLVETTHPGNVGAVARAMKAMGLADLALVSPARFPCAEATARAAGADDLLLGARVCADLDEAVADCAWVVGTSARPRHLAWPTLDPRAAAREVLARAGAGARVALVFGRESRGLSNRELDRCHALVAIPTEADFYSLNLAAAVQVLAWEVRAAALEEGAPTAPAGALATGPADRPATAAELEDLYRHLEAALADIGYLDPAAPRLLMRRLRRLFGRAGLLRSEVAIVRGVLAAAQDAARGGRTR